MGERITKLRKAHNLTQTQVTQQAVQAYEAVSRRIPVSALPMMVARTLSVSLMELFGEEPPQDKSAKRRRGPVPQWQQHIEAIAKLPRSRQQFIAECCATRWAKEPRSDRSATPHPEPHPVAA